MSERCMYCLGLSSRAKEETEVSIEESYLVVSHECLESGRYTEKKFEISYCPYCGRKL